MAIPFRGITKCGDTYFISANCIQHKRVLQSERMATLLIDALYHYRTGENFLLHEFVVMPNHLHLLITPTSTTLEKCLQLIKGGFSYRAKKELEFPWPIWQGSFHDRRIRDASEYQGYRMYIHENPVKAGLCNQAAEWPYSSASGKISFRCGTSGAKAHF